MIIALPDGLPATETLRKEGLGVIAGRDAMLAMINPVRIALVNLMPDKQATETQFARLLARAPYPVELTLVRPASHRIRNNARDHLERFYSPWPSVAGRRFDGVIVTGAPVEQIAFEDVDYWRELTRIFDWAAAEVPASMYVCWAGQAALYHRYGIQKQQMFSKLFGLYEHTVEAPMERAVGRFAETFTIPVSRHTEIHRDDIEAQAGLTVVAASDEAGVGLVRDETSGALINFNHFEYEADTLAREFLRDRMALRETTVPVNYFPGSDPGALPRNNWQRNAQQFFNNWVREAQTGGVRAGLRDRIDYSASGLSA